ncbi:MAG: orotate phosphoribosyltransferase [Desulfurococcales archaeon]|nr:orotate phosphoribosyltransferase [Desulfurococcales archaeon]
MSWLIKELYKLNMIKFGRFKLSSGIESPYYIDLRKLYSFPDLAYKVVRELINIIDAHYECVVGIATAGIPLAAYISCIKRVPMGYVRIEHKNHGLKNIVEGVLEGKKVLVVDDVATTGRSILSAISVLRTVGAKVEAAAVIIDREQGARELLMSNGIKFYSLIRASEFFKILLMEGLINEKLYNNIIKYIEKSKAKENISILST